MAFENITSETTQPTGSYPYLWSFIVTGTFLLIVAILWYFQKPIQQWWHNVGEGEPTAEIVTVPPFLVAEPVITAAPGTTPTPTEPPVYTYISTPTPAAVAPQGTRLPTSGPADSILVIGFSGLALGVALGGNSLIARRKLRSQSRRIDIL